MKASEVKALFRTEAALCEAFIRDMNAIDGWTCYPETGGFDILVVHREGRQIGVEAKLALNAKVIDQILPSDSSLRWCEVGPDHRAVIVPCLTDANEGLAKMLRMLGVEVWWPHTSIILGAGNHYDSVPAFGLASRLHYDDSVSDPPSENLGYHYGSALFDWNPVKRIDLPELPPTTAAGIPAPIQMTPWKQGAIRVLALLRVQGWISTKQISEQGISPSMWMQRWLIRGPIRGQWLEGPHMVKVDQQHPELYALALARAKEQHEKAFALSAPP